MEHDEHGFDAIGDEEDDVYDEDNEDDEDGDALSSSSSIPDEVRFTDLTQTCYETNACAGHRLQLYVRYPVIRCHGRRPGKCYQGRHSRPP